MQDSVQDKQQLRKRLRQIRKDYVTSLPGQTKALLFRRPPAPIEHLIPQGCLIGLYYPLQYEAPSQAYARWFHENGRTIALPAFASESDSMRFREWTDPWDDDSLAKGPFGFLQPSMAAPEVVPDVLFVPLLGFTADGNRLGQGQGHYDRWLAQHPACKAIGLAWDCQLVEQLPVESHDQPLLAVITPTRIYESAA